MVVWASEAVYLRVGLTSGVSSADFRVRSGNYVLVDFASGLPVGTPAVGERWTVKKQGLTMQVAREGVYLSKPYTGPLVLKPMDEKELSLFSFQNIRYRGSLHFINEASGLLLVNNINMEHYLYGVVGREIGNDAGIEALKAQAVASRSYALSMRGTSTRFDVGTDTTTQVYGGYEAETASGSARVIQAVDETAGQVIYYDGKLVRAFFHANAGGYTENSENVWSNPIPYLKATASPADEWALRYPNQASSGWPANSYQWVKRFTRSELENQIRFWNQANSARPDNQVSIGDIQEIRVSRLQRDGLTLTLSGRVTQLDLVGTKGIKSFFRDGIRPVLGLKSTLFRIEKDSAITIMGGNNIKVGLDRGDRLNVIGGSGGLVPPNGTRASYTVKGATEIRDIPKLFQTVSFVGQGHGHGVGMSQWGARGMAEQGYNYQQIIQHYYNPGKDDRLEIRFFNQSNQQVLDQVPAETGGLEAVPPLPMDQPAGQSS